MPALNLAGRQFGRLLVLSRQGSLHGRSAWLCQCSCGKQHVVPASSLTKQLTTSCGCWRRERSKLNAVPKQTVRYRMAHQRLVNSRGPASAHLCIDCGACAAEWSYDHADPNELSEPARNGRRIAYSQDPDRYDPRCRSCHRKLDHQLAQIA